MSRAFLRGVVAGAAGALALLAGCERIAGPGDSEQEDESAPERAGLVVVNLADDFVEFYDSTAGLVPPERVALFKRDIVPLFPEFYGFDRDKGKTTPQEYESRIAREIGNFGAIREKYITKVERFAGDLDANVASFLEVFPDFDTNAEIHLLHSLGEMDGGVREFNGKAHLIFGADGMVRYHRWENETPFFHHELFHLYHSRFFTECPQIWCSLWAEGLAVFVSERMNPGASEAELLLAVPPDLVTDTQRNLAPALVQLKSVLESGEAKDYAGLFQIKEDETGLPSRRAYYLGLLVARELGKTRDLESLARMPNDEVKPVLFETIDRLAAAAQSE